MDRTRAQAGTEVALWMVEGYLPARSPEEFAALVDRVREEIREAGTPALRLLQHAMLPEDEMYLLLVEGPSSEAVAKVSARAGLAPDRVTRAVQGLDDSRRDPREQGTDTRSAEGGRWQHDKRLDP